MLIEIFFLVFLGLIFFFDDVVDKYDSVVCMDIENSMLFDELINFCFKKIIFYKFGIIILI